MITATRRIQFAAGHRVFGHEGKCRYLHGHNFIAFVTAAPGDCFAPCTASACNGIGLRPATAALTRGNRSSVDGFARCFGPLYMQSSLHPKKRRPRYG